MALNHFPHIYQPIDVGSMHMKNRIQFSPIVTNHAEFVSGDVNHELLEEISTQVRTGAGLVTIGSCPIDFQYGRDAYACMSVTRDTDVGGMKRLTQEAHRYDCNLSAEIMHAGQWSGVFGMSDESWVPSIVPEYHAGNPRFREITRAQMTQVTEYFVNAARRLKEANFDMVMAHFAHGNLMSGFLSTIWNQRTDEYGGSAKNRFKFPLEVLEAIYSVTKGEIPIEMRVVGDERLPGGTSLEERIEFLKEASQFVDMLCVSTGTLFYDLPGHEAGCINMPGYYIERGVNVKVASAFKEALGDKMKISVVGGINTLELAEQILAEGKADMVAMAKALIADDRMIVKGERGQEKDIKPCLRCMYCLREMGGPHIHGCTANPRMGWEYRYPRFMPAKKHKKVMIIGGGPGGMEAARILAERGHEVHLYDKEDSLGGRLPEASALWLKDGFRRYAKWAVRTTSECGAQIHLGVTVTPETIKELNPDTVIIATGAKDFCPPIKGIDGENVVSVIDVDRGKVTTGQKIVICGAGLSGSECAIGLRHEGKDVTVVDTLPQEKLWNNMSIFARPLLIKHLRESGVVSIYEAKVKEVTADGVIIVTKEGNEELIPADTVITAFGIRANKDEIEALADVVPETYIIGDAHKVGVIGDATNDAYRVCLDVDGY